MKLRTWSGIAWYGEVFDNEEEAKTWAESDARGRRRQVGTWNGESSGEWIAKVHN